MKPLVQTIRAATIKAEAPGGASVRVRIVLGPGEVLGLRLKYCDERRSRMCIDGLIGSAWEITKDHLFRPGDELIGGRNDEGTQGPRLGDMTIPRTHRFRMYDDDGELYYEGLCAKVSFAPLDDFGKPNAGCTRIDYLNPQTQKWETL